MSRMDKARNGLTIIGAIIDLGFTIADRIRARRARRKARREQPAEERKVRDDDWVEP
jgi:hypothetical protein